MADFASKTLSPGDLAHPDVSPAARRMRRFVLRLALSGTPFAQNAVLRWRLHAQRHKLWEYVRGVAFLEQAGARRVLDFGGAGTLPVLYHAARGCEVLTLDIDAKLVQWTNRLAAQKGWKLSASTHDLTAAPLPQELGLFDAVISYSVLEHLPESQQRTALQRLGALVKPGGVMAITFDYGPDAAQPHAPRTPSAVEELVAATGLVYENGRPFQDTGERFVLDRRYPDHAFTFGSLFLRKPG